MFVSGLRRCLGRVQPQLSPLLHESLDQAEQQVPALPAGVDRPEVGKVKTDQNQPTDQSDIYFLCDIED